MNHTQPQTRPIRSSTARLTRGARLLSATALLAACGEQAAEQPETAGSSTATASSDASSASSTTHSSTSSSTTTNASTTTQAGSTSSTAATSTSSQTTTSGRPSSDDETTTQASTSAETSASSGATSSTGEEDTSSDTDETSSTSGETGSQPETSPGCGAAAPESGRFDIDVNGETRAYIIAIPEDYDPSKAYRLVFAWHPWGGSAEQTAGSGGRGYYGLQGEADGEAIFVSPDGLDFGGMGQGWGNEDGKDLAFFDAMVERFETELCIDQSRIFSVGFSFGGMMSWALGCGRGDVVRAIAPMAGNTGVSGCLDGDSPVAVMGFHGDDDEVVAIDGGRAGRDVFVERNHCGEVTASESTYCDGVEEARQPCTCTTYEGCDEGYPVTWCEFNGPHTPAPNSAATIWNFFKQF